MNTRVPLRWLLVLLVAAVTAAITSAQQAPSFNYGEALQKAIFFYEAQISGPKPPWSRVTWRGDSGMNDGADVGVDLRGGWYDAGDHVKFGFAMASSATMLAWGGVEYRAAFESKGQLVHLQNNLRFVNDYFIKAHTAPNELWGQVGDGNSDHSFWGSAEIMHLKTNRPAFRITMSCGGSDLAAETAAAMAASSIVFRPTDPAYADTLVTHARQLFAFAEATNPSWYVDCIPGAPFYDSHNGRPEDEMTWAAVWLFRATGEQAFMTRARQLYPTMCKEGGTGTPCFTWTQNWNDKHFGVYVLMSKLTGEAAFRTDAERWLDYWTVGTGAATRTTPGGLMFVHNFGSLRYATNTAFVALVYADFLGTGNPLFARYHDFAKRQVDYVLGANPRNSSYMVGFGNNPPRNPHHRTAHGTWVNNASGEPAISRHTLYGAMVAGPDAQSDTAWSDDRTQFMRTEPATDMNAGLTGALARLSQEFGGTPLANFPPVETPGDEIFMEAQINVQGPNFTEIRAFLNNESAWPSRNLTQGTFRYYFTLEPGVTPAQVTLTGNFNQCGTSNLTGPTLFSGNIFFVTVSCVGTPIYPGGQDVFRREVQFRISVPPNVPGNWDPSNDYSFQGLTTSAAVRTSRIVAFDGAAKVWGDEPGAATPDFALSANPAAVAVTRGSSATSTITIAPTGGFTSSVALSASALPAGVTATFSPASTTGASTLTLAASATASLGAATVIVSGTGGGITHTTSVALTVNDVQVPDFTLAAAPSSVSVAQGASGGSTINITRSGGFTAAVAFSTSTLPAGVTASFNPASATGNSSVLTFTASATATTGTSNVTVTGSGGGLTRTAAIGLTVSAGGGGTGGGGVTVTALINQNTPWFNEQDLRLDNTGTLTALSVAIVIQRTTGVSFSNLYNTIGGQILQSNSSTADAITYQWTLGSGTLGAGTGKLFAAQTGGTGTLHPVAGDTWSVTYTTGGQTFTQSGTFGVGGGGGDFSLAASPTSLTVGAGGTGGTSTITITRSAGFTGAVAFTASGLPSGVTAAFNPTSTTGNSSVMTLTAAAGAASGTSTITITGTSGSLSHTTTVGLTVTSPADFTLSSTPNAVSVPVGGGATATVNITRSNFTGAVAFTASGLPTGVSAAFNPSSATGNSSVATFTASSTAAVGTFVVTITGTGGGLTRTATVNLSVIAAADFTLAASPTSLSIAAGASGTTTLTVTRTGGFADTVSCSISGQPAGVTGTFNPASITGTSSILTLAVPAGIVSGTTTVTITCTSGALTRTTTIGVTIPTAQDFSLSPCSPGPIVVLGGSASCTITITRTGGFTGAVSFAASGLPAGVTAAFNPASTTGTSTVLSLTASIAAATGTSTVTVTGTSGALSHGVAVSLTVTPTTTVNAYTQRFLDMYDEIHGINGQGNNGYFHPSNIPYHSVETLMVEAPDQGHETTSEAYSFWGWLEVMHGRVTGDWTGLQQMWDSMEANIIPTAADQPTNSFYNPGDPADYAPEGDLPSAYPALISSSVPTGSDPIGAALRTTYGTSDIYGMHWIIDVDNFYGYGRRGDHVSQPSYMNTFQRGPQESTWETIPQPSWEDFLSGGSATAGFLPLFITGPAPVQQWRYTNAPDADARLIQAMYWANQAAPTNPTVAALSAKAGRMGDYLRYAFFDKYFKTMGCTSPQCPAGTGYNGAHFLLSWYYAWGGPIPPQGGWAFRIGSSHNHFGYQNLMAAHALTTVAAMRPASGAQAQTDWTTSLRRQIEFYRWLQSADGGIGGGATNSLGGRYLAPTSPIPTFYGMFYQENPVYLDPGSNTWFGFQAWSMERVAEYYEETNSPEAKIILDKWIPWAMNNTILNPDGTFLVPSTLAWSGQPSTNWNATTQNWDPADTAFNANLRVTVTERGTDLGVTAALAKTLIYYSAGTRRWATQHLASQILAKELLDRMWTLFRDGLGVSAPESRADYNRFDDSVFVPAGFNGTMENGDPINSASTFLSLRSDYRNDPNFAQVQAYLNGGPAPTFRYHRFWAQVDVALANAEYGRFFP